MTTETLDKLYLEWSQFTKARTERELRYEALLRRCVPVIRRVPNKFRNGENISLPDQIEAAINTSDVSFGVHFADHPNLDRTVLAKQGD